MAFVMFFILIFDIVARHLIISTFLLNIVQPFDTLQTDVFHNDRDETEPCNINGFFSLSRSSHVCQSSTAHMDATIINIIIIMPFLAAGVDRDAGDTVVVFRRSTSRRRNEVTRIFTEKIDWL